MLTEEALRTIDVEERTLVPTKERQPYGLFTVTVAAIQVLSPHFVRVTFTGEEVRHFGTAGLDQRIKIALPLAETGFTTFPTGSDWFAGWRALPEEQRNPVRTYTARAVRPERAEFDVDFVAHGDAGPASRWVLNTSIGDELIVVGPDSRSTADGGGIDWRPGAVGSFLIAGDETAAPAICSILESLPANAVGCALIEVPTASDVLEVSHPAGIELQWLTRDGSDTHYGAALVEAVREWGSARTAVAVTETPQSIDDEFDLLWDVPEGQSTDGELYAWLAGEASAITTIRRYLVSELGINRSSVAFMGYWRHGRPGN